MFRASETPLRLLRKQNQDMRFLIIDDDEEDRDTKYSSFCVLACLAASKACETSDGNNEFSKHRTINLGSTARTVVTVTINQCTGDVISSWITQNGFSNPKQLMQTVL